MQIILHIDKRKLDKDYEQAIGEYVKRISAFATVSMKLYKDFGKLELKDSSYKLLIATGKRTVGSVEFAKKISDIGVAGYSCIEFIIPDEISHPDYVSFISDELLSKTDCGRLNLTTIRMGVDATATALVEQIYRAYTINNNISYHK